MFPVNHLSEGLAMGAAISSIFKEICLPYFEYANIIDIQTRHKVIRYFIRGQYRLIHKLFLKNTNTNSMSAECNNICGRLYFKMEEASLKKVNFPDITIKNNLASRKLQFTQNLQQQNVYNQAVHTCHRHNTQ
jgi:hypothetical protein